MDACYRYSDDTLEKYAQVLYWGLETARRKPLPKSSLVLVRYDLPGLPLAEAVTSLLHEKSMVPVVRAELTPRMEHDFYAMANNKRLTMDIPGERELYSSLNGSIRILAPQSLRHLADIEPELLQKHLSSRKPLQDILSTREAAAFGRTMGVYPTPALAEAAGMSLEEYAAKIKRACRLDNGTPLTQWKLYQKKAKEMLAWLDSLDIQSLRVQSASMDLLLNLGGGRRWVGLTGRNIPSFEFYTSPDWRGSEGEYYADQPSYRSGTLVEGLRLKFRRGEAVTVSAKRGQALAFEQLTASPGANRIGEFALVDKRFSRIDSFMANTMYDENFGGTHGSCHIAMGQSYRNAYAGSQKKLNSELRKRLGFNESPIHWDLVNTEPKTVHAVLADGTKRIIYKDGQFQNSTRS